MILGIPGLARAAALLFSLSGSAAAQWPTFDYDKLREETAERL